MAPSGKSGHRADSPRVNRETSRPSEPDNTTQAGAPQQSAVPGIKPEPTPGTSPPLAAELEELNQKIQTAKQTLDDSVRELDRLKLRATAAFEPPGRPPPATTVEHLAILGQLVPQWQKVVITSYTEFKWIAEVFDRMRLAVLTQDAIIRRLCEEVVTDVEEHRQAERNRNIVEGSAEFRRLTGHILGEEAQKGPVSPVVAMVSRLLDEERRKGHVVLKRKKELLATVQGVSTETEGNAGTEAGRG